MHPLSVGENGQWCQSLSRAFSKNTFPRMLGYHSYPVHLGSTLCNTLQGHPTDRFCGISVRKTCNRLKFSVREMSSRAFLINAFCFWRDKNDVLGTKVGQLGISERQ